MRCFPQMSTGSVAQYPISRSRRMRSVVNETPGGSRIAWADPCAESVEWEIPLSGLTAEELGALEELYEECEGRAADFLFLDPLDNLFGWSEDFLAPAWTADPLLECQAGRPDPLGTSRATRLVNTAQAPQRLTQAIGGPGWYRFSVSARVRSEVPSALTLVLSSGGLESSRSHEIGPEWREIWFSAIPGGTGETVTAGLELESGAAVDVFGLQLEAQAGPSPYKRTPGRGGVYPLARFADERLVEKAEGANWLSTTVRIRSRREDT